MNLKPWVERMEDSFPMETSDGQFSLEFAGPAPSDDGEVRALIRLVVFANVDGELQLRDVKEQHVPAGTAAQIAEIDRYGEFLRALGVALGDLDSDALHDFNPIPSDLFPVDVLDLEAKSFDDLGRALMAKSRLGRFR